MRQPLAHEEVGERQRRRLHVAAVTEAAEDIGEEPLRIPAGGESAARALLALAVLVAALVVDGRPGRAALVDVASHPRSPLK